MTHKLDRAGYPVSVLHNFSSGPPDVSLITYGGLSRFVPTILQHMAEEEIKVVACIPTAIKPPPWEAIEEVAAESGRVVIAEECSVHWGWGAEITAHLHTALFHKLSKPVCRIGARETVIPAAKELEQAVLPSSRDIEAALSEMLE
jgi:acetoin:2,6-dichlorophenolindophenol oxidoreductase subunit beta